MILLVCAGLLASTGLVPCWWDIVDYVLDRVDAPPARLFNAGAGEWSTGDGRRRWRR